jgi:hypothetical protein
MTSWIASSSSISAFTDSRFWTHSKFRTTLTIPVCIHFEGHFPADRRSSSCKAEIFHFLRAISWLKTYLTESMTAGTFKVDARKDCLDSSVGSGKYIVAIQGLKAQKVNGLFAFLYNSYSCTSHLFFVPYLYLYYSRLFGKTFTHDGKDLVPNDSWRKMLMQEWRCGLGILQEERLGVLVSHIVHTTVREKLLVDQG